MSKGRWVSRKIQNEFLGPQDPHHKGIWEKDKFESSNFGLEVVSVEQS